MRILVVDPDDAHRRMAVSALQASGHEVVGVASGDDAIDRAGATAFHGVVTELEIGGMNGLDLMARLRDDPRHEAASVILMTFPMDIEELRRAFSLGISGYVSKPVELETFVYQVEHLLGAPEDERATASDDDGASTVDEESSIGASVEVEMDRVGPEDGELPGQVLEGKYLVEEIIGAGGMGEVYRARHVYLDRLVAVKVLPQTGQAGSDLFSRFIREARILARLRSRRIVEIHDFGFTPWKSPYLVMELLEGRNLDQLIDEHGQLPIPLVEEIAIQVAEGLSAAHDAGVLHLDFKPSNVMIAGRHDDLPRLPLDIKLLDFGIARFIEEAKAAGGGRGGGGGSDSVTGTVAYMSPEQCRGEELRPQSDLYAVGAVLYEMLTGRPPFTGISRAELMLKHQRDVPQSPAVYRPEIPEYLEEIVVNLLSKAWQDRISSADELLVRLQVSASITTRRTLRPVEDQETEGNLDSMFNEAMEITIMDLPEGAIQSLPSDDEGEG